MMRFAGESGIPRYWPVGQRRILVLLVLSVLYVMSGGCATWQAPAPMDDSKLRARAVGETVRDVHLSATVVSAEDSIRIFGFDVGATGIQPVWIEAENRTPHMLWLLRAGTDPDYFSSGEVAWSFHKPFAARRNASVDEHFDSLEFENPIPPGSKRSGIIFTNPHHRTRVLNVDFLGPGKLIPFTLFLPDPNNPPDEAAYQVVFRHAALGRSSFEDSDALRTALEAFACCAQGAGGGDGGDPLNVVFVGHVAHVASALVRRGYRSGRSPADDNQRLFGRRPDFVMRKAGQSDAPANWIRGWVAPFQYRGNTVSLVQAGRPLEGRFGSDDGGLLLHPRIDEPRDLLIQDLLYSGGVAKLGFVEGLGAVETHHARVSAAEAKYRTDGLRAVMFFVPRPRALSDLELLDWSPMPERRDVDGK
jgi:hypothetical protein